METNTTTAYAQTVYCPYNMCRHTASEVIFTANKSPFSEDSYNYHAPHCCAIYQWIKDIFFIHCLSSDSAPHHTHTLKMLLWKKALLPMGTAPKPLALETFFFLAVRGGLTFWKILMKDIFPIWPTSMRLAY